MKIIHSLKIIVCFIAILITLWILLRNYIPVRESFENPPNLDLAKQLTVYASPFSKIRIGREADGGYIIADIPDANYTTLLAGGINDDISFEEDFLSRYPEVQCYAFDGTIDGLPKENGDIIFIKKNIGFENSDTLTNIHDIIHQNSHIFVKMDIEGGEIPWLKSLSDDQMNKFEQIVMEFHHPFTMDEKDVFDKLNKHHYLIHIHGNNSSGIRKQQGVYIPEIFECTYLHKKYFLGVPELNTDMLPGELDRKNIPHKDDIYLHYMPFVN